MSILDTGVKNVRNVLRYTIGEGAVTELTTQLAERRAQQADGQVVYFVDEFFRNQRTTLEALGLESNDELLFVATTDSGL